jgi:hypothetical protein
MELVSSYKEGKNFILGKISAKRKAAVEKRSAASL